MDTLRISVIIPTLNEAEHIAAAVSQVLALGDVEVIVADGGSTDDTRRLAAEQGAIVIEAKRGRGSQLDAGAKTAKGDVFLFLHADTRLPDDAVDHIRVALADDDIVGGNFYLYFLPLTPAGVAFTLWGHARRMVFRGYGGQSGIFVRRETFEKLGGFGDLPVLEDTEFVRKLERAGDTVHLPTWAKTSARRFVGREWRALFQGIAVHGLHRAGVPARWLVRFRRDFR